MKKYDIFLIAWCSFFSIFDLVLIMMDGFTSLRLTALIINLACLIMVLIDNEAYLKEKFKKHILKHLQ